MFLFDIRQGVIEHPATIASETPIANDSPPPSQVATPEGGPSVLVLLKFGDASAYERASYEGVDRPAPQQGNSFVGRLLAAMNQLVKGPTPQERGQGLSSVFSPETAGLVESVGVDESGAATVSFRDFREELPGLSTTEGGTVLMLQLNHTVFQFNSVDRVEYQIEGQCATFGEFGRRRPHPRSTALTELAQDDVHYFSSKGIAESLTAEQVHELEPDLAPVRGALLFRDQAWINPLRLAATLVRQVGRIATRTEGLRLVIKGARVTAVETTNGVVHPGAVVFATGLAQEPWLRLTQRRVKGHLIAIAPGPFSVRRMVGEPNMGIVPLPGGNLVAGGTHDAHDVSPEVRPETAAGIKRRLAELIP